MATVQHSESLAASLIAAAQSLLNNASGLRAEIKTAIRRQDRATIDQLSFLGLQATLFCIRIEAFTETHCEAIHDLGQQSLLDHLYYQQGALKTASSLLKSLIILSK
jgi:hypothetical protein